jgi:hypothetical protein
MLRITRLLGTLTITAIALPAHAQAPAAQQGVLRVPVADRKPHETRIHGYTLTDNYFWLREKSDPAVRAYLEAENAYTAAVMKPTEPLQQAPYDEMLHRIKQTDQTASYRDGGYTYYSRTVEGQQYPADDSGRIGGRSLDGGGDEHATGSLPGGERGGSVRRRDEHDARRVAALDDERVYRVGKP